MECGLVSVCPSVTSSIETAERIKLAFGIEASLRLPYNMFRELRVSPKMTVLYFPVELLTLDTSVVAIVLSTSFD